MQEWKQQLREWKRHEVTKKFEESLIEKFNESSTLLRRVDKIEGVRYLQGYLDALEWALNWAKNEMEREEE